MMQHLYDTATGLFTGVTLRGPAHLIAVNTPSGTAVFTADAIDHLAQKIDLQTGQVVDYQPPAPSDDVNNTWAWDAPTKRWMSAPTLAALKTVRIAEVQAAIEAQEQLQDRPQRELMSAFHLALPAPPVALNRMLTIDNEITRLRGLRAACAAATTKAQLDAAPRP